MKDEMIEFYNQSVANGLCAEYSDMWKKCKSRRNLVDFCLRLDSIEYIAESRAKKIGISNKYINEVFCKYINGKYIAKVYSDDECYRTAELYCEYHNIVNTKSDYIHIIDSNCSININDWQVLFVYVSGKSELGIAMGKNSIVYVYCYDNACIKHNSMDIENSKIIIKQCKYE